MIRTLGLIELNSIARGYEAADAMLKVADVTLLKAHSICPGKFIVMVHGDIAAVKSSVEAGVEIAGSYMVDKLVLPSLHRGIIPAITGTSTVEVNDALGTLEYFNIASAIIAADAAAKAAHISLIEIRLGYAVGGKAFVTLTGDVSAVESAVSAGEEVGKNSGMLLGSTVIPRMHPELKAAIL
jgi:microcompartment protein CcmL/EutN